MYTDHLKTTLEGLASLRGEIAAIEARHAKSAHGSPCYPSMCGALQATIGFAVDQAASALKWTADHVAPAEAEGERLISILEALGIDLDEETLAALELAGKRTWSNDPAMPGTFGHRETSPYSDQRRSIASAVSKAVCEVQESEREAEHDAAHEALLSAGFVYDEDEDTFKRDDEWVTVTLTNGRESRYEWVYQSNGCAITDSGKSGEFSRLIALIQKKEVMQ